MFDDDILLTQTDWYFLSSRKVQFDNWKELDNNKIKAHVNKVKDYSSDKFEKEACAEKIMTEESFGLHNSITLG